MKKNNINWTSQYTEDTTINLSFSFLRCDSVLNLKSSKLVILVRII